MGHQRLIEEHVRGQPPLSACSLKDLFPFFRRNHLQIRVGEAGFETAATTVWGLNQHDEDRFQLKRFGPWDSELGPFALKLDWYRITGIPTFKGSGNSVRAGEVNAL